MSHPPSSQCAAKDFAATYSCWPVSDATDTHGRFRRPLYRRFVAMITAAHPGSWFPTGMGGGNDELPAEFASCVGHFRSSACGSTRVLSPRPGRPHEARRRAPKPKKNRRKGLVLGRRSNVLLNPEMTQNASTSGPPRPESGACRERGRSGQSSEHRGARYSRCNACHGDAGELDRAAEDDGPLPWPYKDKGPVNEHPIVRRNRRVANRRFNHRIICSPDKRQAHGPHGGHWNDMR
jgi:hypothetical protein